HQMVGDDLSMSFVDSHLGEGAPCEFLQILSGGEAHGCDPFRRILLVSHFWWSLRVCRVRILERTVLLFLLSLEHPMPRSPVAGRSDQSLTSLCQRSVFGLGPATLACPGGVWHRRILTV